ncbi:phage terminase small subunit [Anaerospora hongkongensis]|uniref:Phage terminase small subunit n=1 Tax=Anaerospora hongkongensis TaxID=244830 RepID=A0A4R1Q4D5_9FIRM|nr:terminase small subunit [Anaerospora hongkongensis]TCL35635.1 phage terminase small subunit [Anaerospora hongkongensis]
MAITDKQEKFVQAIITGMSQREAYRSAYPKSKNWADNVVDVKASELLKNGKVLVRYNELHDRLIKEAEDECIVSAKEVLRELKNIVMTDTNELVELRRCCCRYCWGENFQYQFTMNEFKSRQANYEIEAAVAVKEGKEVEPFNPLGGMGYNATKEPNIVCPECFGQGVYTSFFHDTRNLSPAAKSLYAGVKVTKDGIEVKMHSKDKMIELLGRHLGMFKDKLEIENKVANPYEGLTKEQLLKLAREGDG